MKGYLVLGEYLGLATVVVGLLTGSFLGIALDAVEWSWLKGVKQYFVTEANYGQYLNGYNPMMVVAVVIGIIQILFGMCLSAAKLTKQFGFKYGNVDYSVGCCFDFVRRNFWFTCPGSGIACNIDLYFVWCYYGLCFCDCIYEFSG